MKKIIKNNIKVIITIIICAVVFTGVGAYAAYNYQAKDISFTPSNESWEVENVEDAINDLYSSKKTNMKYVTSAASDTANSVTANRFVVGEYYFCTSNIRGTLNKYSINGAEIIYEKDYGDMLDYAYINYLMYIKAEATTINFSYTSNSNKGGMSVICYQFE